MTLLVPESFLMLFCKIRAKLLINLAASSNYFINIKKDIANVNAHTLLI